MVSSSRFRHPDFGDVKITVNGAARRIRARWVGAELRVTVPPMLPVSQLERFFHALHDRLLASKPEPRYSIGQTIDAYEVDFSIVEGWETDKGDIFMTMVENNPARHKFKNYYIHLSPDAVADISHAEVQEYIYKLIIWGAREATGRFIVPHARELAQRIGRRPLGWAVKESKTKLGSCSSTGFITLSPRLIFLPPELRDFVIYHELAHLSEMNHSAAFHELCNAYCDGREAELQRRLRAWRFPLL